MATKIVYQTLEDKDNPDSIEKHGPFICTRQDAWLGDGYYFWESFIQNAHWWGKECYGHRNGHIICEATYTEDKQKCFNLIDNPEHLEMFRSTIQLMKEMGLYIQGQTTVAQIIHYLRNTLKIFHYEATRVYGINSKSHKSEFSTQAIFNNQNPQKYLDLCPAIQICFYSKKSMNLSNYKIIFPNEYIDGYVI